MISAKIAILALIYSGALPVSNEVKAMTEEAFKNAAFSEETKNFIKNYKPSEEIKNYILNYYYAGYKGFLKQKEYLETNYAEPVPEWLSAFDIKSNDIPLQDFFPYPT